MIFNWDTSLIKNMDKIFDGCNSLNSIPLIVKSDNLDIINFDEDYQVKSPPLKSKWDIDFPKSIFQMKSKKILKEYDYEKNDDENYDEN